jgi:hypothetical protein
MGEKIAMIIMVFLILGLLGGCVYSVVDDYNQNVDDCTYDAKILGVESKYSGECFLQTENGIWLPGKDYLMLRATNCVKP